MSIKRRIRVLEGRLDVHDGRCSTCGGQIQQSRYALEVAEGQYELEDGTIVSELPEEPDSCCCSPDWIIVAGTEAEEDE